MIKAIIRKIIRKIESFLDLSEAKIIKNIQGVRVIKSRDVISYERKRTQVIVFKDLNLVVKRFKNKNQNKSFRKSNYHSWLRELECLKRLQKNNKHFPTLIGYDKSDLSIQMSYCGESIPERKMPELLPQIIEICECLERANIKLITKNACRDRLLILNGVLKMIDFEDCLPDKTDAIELYGEEFVNLRREKFLVGQFEKELRRVIIHGKPFKPKKTNVG